MRPRLCYSAWLSLLRFSTQEKHQLGRGLYCTELVAHFHKQHITPSCEKGRVYYRYVEQGTHSGFLREVSALSWGCAASLTRMTASGIEKKYDMSAITQSCPQPRKVYPPKDPNHLTKAAFCVISINSVVLTVWKSNNWYKYFLFPFFPQINIFWCLSSSEI